MKKLLAVDPSLTASGWVLFAISSGEIERHGLLSPPGPRTHISKRYDQAQREVEELIGLLELGASDVLVCEGPAPLVLNPSSSIKVERIRGIFESVARSRGLTVPGRVNPRTVHTELLGLSGRQLPRSEVKAAARIAAERLYGARRCADVAQDIIDAMLLGTIALSRIQLALQCGLDVHESFERGNDSRRGGRGRYPGWGSVANRRSFK